MTQSVVIQFSDIAPGDIERVGGKGANLGKLSRAGLRVPEGFCVATPAFWSFVSEDRVFDEAIATFDGLDANDIQAVRAPAAALRAHLTTKQFPPAIADAVLEAWRATGADEAYAVRSSATAEDLPDASFAGQQDTYLNVMGEESLLKNMAISEFPKGRKYLISLSFRVNRAFGLYRSAVLM